MKQLPQTFKRNGFTFGQMEREGNVAIYRKHKGRISSFEVVLIQSHNGRIIMGEVIPPSEFYPSSEQWGTKGWTLAEADYHGAHRKFLELLK